MLIDDLPFLDAVSARHFGKYRGRVVDNADPVSRGRVQVVVPALLAEQPVWALPCAPYAGPNVGFFAMPPVGAGVWVEFEGGDLDLPIWSGCFWADGEIASGDAAPSVKFWITDAVSIRIDDDAGEIVVKTSGATLTLTASEITADASTVTEKAMSSQITVSASGFDVNNGAFTVV
ncbi:phage baseplate assembly protein V [Sphingomonas sp. BIUV-7]|uniref:Phage baseplate assembly protein V n=1 Tax=Sphingomonas natans TaxID=3063330 RepID=A0ABT8YCN5_9SPHN|nr:phage baseplate assembly protein V [Sphingomonas sp. BIUV-7]